MDRKWKWTDSVFYRPPFLTTAHSPLSLLLSLEYCLSLFISRSGLSSSLQLAITINCYFVTFFLLYNFLLTRKISPQVQLVCLR